WMLGDLKSALSDYDMAIELQPRCPWFYNNRGRAKQANGNLQGAIDDFTRATEVNDAVFRSDVALAHGLRGLALLRQGRDTEAQRDLMKAVELDGSLETWVRRESERISRISLLDESRDEAARTVEPTTNAGMMYAAWLNDGRDGIKKRFEE